MNTNNASPTSCKHINHSTHIQYVVFCGRGAERVDKRLGTSPNLNRRGGTKTSTTADSSIFLDKHSISSNQKVAVSSADIFSSAGDCQGRLIAVCAGKRSGQFLIVFVVSCVKLCHCTMSKIRMHKTSIWRPPSYHGVAKRYYERLIASDGRQSHDDALKTTHDVGSFSLASPVQ